MLFLDKSLFFCFARMPNISTVRTKQLVNFTDRPTIRDLRNGVMTTSLFLTDVSVLIDWLT